MATDLLSLNVDYSKRVFGLDKSLCDESKVTVMDAEMLKSK